MYSKEEIAQMTPTEQAVARDMNAAEEAGGDMFGDGTPGDDTTSTTDQPDAAAQAEGEGAPDDAAGAEAAADDDTDPKPDDAPADAGTKPEPQPAAATATEEQAAEAATETPAYRLPDVSKIPEERKALRAQHAEMQAKWAAGTLTDEEYAKQSGEVSDKLDALTRAETRAETIAEINAQTAMNERMRVATHYIAEGAKVGIDYNQDKHLNSFKRIVGALEADPDWQGKSFADVAAEAHRTVLAMNGKLGATPAPVPPAAAPTPAAQRKAPDAPQTLRTLPAAAQANVGDDVEAQWKAATGAAADALWQKLTPAQQNKLLQDA